APFADLGTTTETSLSATLTNGTVEWFVQTLFDGCPSLDSQHVAFTIPKAQSCPQSGAAPQSPVAGTQDHSPVTFTWSAAPNALAYELWLSLDHGPASLLGTTAATSLARNVAPGAIEWYVVTRFNGCPSVESAPAPVTLTAPPDRAATPSHVDAASRRRDCRVDPPRARRSDHGQRAGQLRLERRSGHHAVPSL